jgi:hypothetical protein
LKVPRQSQGASCFVIKAAPLLQIRRRASFPG